MGSPNNPLASLLGQYDSDDDTDEETPLDGKGGHYLKDVGNANQEPPPPATETPVLSNSNMVLQCAWSACYDESSGYTYYWNQYTNQVTWEPPPDYLQAIKMASLQATKAQSEVSSEEWQMYQQVLAEQKATTKPKPTAPASNPKVTKSAYDKRKKRRPSSDTEDEKIELITSYYNSDSESNDETDKVISSPTTIESHKPDNKHVSKKLKKKHQVPVGAVAEYGPSLPPNQYTADIGPQLAPGHIVDTEPPKEEFICESERSIVVPVEKVVDSPNGVVPNGDAVLLSNGEADTEMEEAPELSPKTVLEEDARSDDSQDESVLIRKLAEKTEILKNLGGEVPTEIDDLLKHETESTLTTEAASAKSSPKSEDVNESVVDDDLHKQVELFEKSVDEMLAEIESKEMKKKPTSNESDDRMEILAVCPRSESSSPPVSVIVSDNSIPSSASAKTPLFPSASTTVLFPSAQNIPVSVSKTDITEPPISPSIEAEPEVAKVICQKKGANLYMRSPSEEVEMITTKRKKRIATDVLPEVVKEKKKVANVLPEVKQEKKIEKPLAPSYTTKYSQYIEGFSSERTGLGFSTIADDDETLESDKKKAFVYGKYSKPVVMFTKGEVLHEEKKDLEVEVPKEVYNEAEEIEETSESLSDTLQAKLKFLNQNSVELPPVQEMIIQFECLSSAWRAGALLPTYWSTLLDSWARALRALEARAAPLGWHCRFQREEGRYQYKRVCDGFVQWDYPQDSMTKEEVNDDDMDICTTPPPGDQPVQPEYSTPAQIHSRIPAVRAAPPNLVATVPTISTVQQKKPSVPGEIVNPPLPSFSQPAPPPPPSWDPEPPPPPPPAITAPLPPLPSACPPLPKTRRHASPPPPPPGTDEEEHAMYKLPAEKERVASPTPPPPPPPIITPDPSLGDELMSFYSDLAELEKQPEAAPPPEAPYHPAEPPRPKQTEFKQTAEDKILNSLWSTAKKVDPSKKLSAEPADSPRLRDNLDGTKLKKKTKVKLSSSVGLKNKNVSSLVAKWQQVKEANKDDDD